MYSINSIFSQCFGVLSMLGHTSPFHLPLQEGFALCQIHSGQSSECIFEANPTLFTISALQVETFNGIPQKATFYPHKFEFESQLARKICSVI